jgi:hypothetical protein
MVNAKSPNLVEVERAIEQSLLVKLGSDGLPVEIYRYGGDHLIVRLTFLFKVIWQMEYVPQDFKDATLIHLYKKKSDRPVCDNHRVISLLCTEDICSHFRRQFHSVHYKLFRQRSSKVRSCP